jgi:DNA mismatch repair protein MutS
MQAEKNTPLMQQYFDIKQQYQDTLLLFQVGDFYELFFDDAKKAAAFLGIALTSRGKNNGEPIPLCGVPLHAKDHYLAKLIKGGFKVALCDQLEEATPGKLVARAVTQVLTPGTLTDSNLLDEKSSSYLCALYPADTECALLFGELLTAQLWATIVPADEQRIVESELVRFFPDELLIPDIRSAKPWVPFLKKLGYFTTQVQAGVEDDDSFRTAWLPLFAPATQQYVNSNSSLQAALFYFYAYVKKTQNSSLAQFNQLSVYKPDDFLIMDAATQRNLDLTRNQHDGSRQHTLFSILDGATTPMGSRMIKKWIVRPLVKKEAIIQRQDAIGLLAKDVIRMQMLQQLLAPLGDIERVIGRIVLERAQVHDYDALKRCLDTVPLIKQHINSLPTELFAVINHHCGNFEQLQQYLDRALVDEPSATNIIKPGFDKQLDYMRELIAIGNEKLIALEQQEIIATGIQSLKIRYNNVHGYYIEITNSNKHLVPERYMRRQTLVGKERYITQELQQLAYDIERAHANIQERERILFEMVKQEVSQWNTPLRKLSNALAYLDALHGFAKVAYNNGYVRPELTDARDIIIIDGRHPIVEQQNDIAFIPNDTQLIDLQSLWIVTGPNMGGKSTYLRQVALLCIMAQCGSFIPVKQAQLPILDRIFTRIGAGDNLAAGKSTFLVEMEETASICTQATKHSLVILDEVGRGTSTFDGLAIAQAVIEYLYEQVGARCLFATHYHELTQLSSTYSGIVPFYAASKKTNNGIMFLYKMVQGVADGSFGVEVAKLAHLPPKVIDRAQELLITLMHKEQKYMTNNQDVDNTRAYAQLLASHQKLREQFEQLERATMINNKFSAINFDELSPKQAFDLLWQWKQELL